MLNYYANFRNIEVLKATKALKTTCIYWSTLQKEFKLKTLRRCEFELLNMKEFENIKNYYYGIKEIANQMTTCERTDKKILVSISYKLGNCND